MVGTAVGKVANRSYVVEASQGRYRQNRKCFIPLSKINLPQRMDGIADSDEIGSSVSVTIKDTFSTTRSKRQAKPSDLLYELTLKEGRCCMM